MYVNLLCQKKDIMKPKPQRNWSRCYFTVLSVILATLSLNVNAATQTLINESSYPKDRVQSIQLNSNGQLTIQFLNSNDQADRFSVDEDFPDGLIYYDYDHTKPVNVTSKGGSGVNIVMTYENIAAGSYYFYSPYNLKNLSVVLSYDDHGGAMPNAFMTGNNSGYYKNTISEVIFFWQGDRELTLGQNTSGIKLIKEGIDVTATPEIVDNGHRLKITFTPEISALNFKQVFSQTGTSSYSLFLPAGLVNVNVNGVWRPSQEVNAALYLDPEKQEAFLSEGDDVKPFSVVPDIYGAEGAYCYFNCPKDGLYLFHINSVPSNIIGAPMAFYYQDNNGKWVKANYSLYSYWWTGRNFEGYIELKAGTTYNIYGESGYDGKPYHNNYAQYCTLSYIGDPEDYPVTKIAEGQVFESPLKNISLQFRDNKTVYNLKGTPTVKLTRDGVNVTDVTAIATLQADNQTVEVTFDGNGLTTPGNYTLTLNGMTALFLLPNHQFQNPNWNVSFILKEEDDREFQLIQGTFSPEAGMIFTNEEEISVNITFDGQPIIQSDACVLPASLNDTPLSWDAQVSIEGNSILVNLGILSEIGDYTLTLNQGAVFVGDDAINAKMTWTCIVEKNTTGISLILPDSDNLFKVYNLNGVNILTTDNASDVLGLPKGIYLVNGVKFVVK